MNPRNPPAGIIRRDPRHYALLGDLTFDTAAALLHSARGVLAEAKRDVEIDLAETRAVDSAGVALLIELVRFAMQRDIRFCFTNVSQQLESLAAVSGVEGLLPCRSGPPSEPELNSSLP